MLSRSSVVSVSSFFTHKIIFVGSKLSEFLTKLIGIEFFAIAKV
jgi:hypothetical protein